MVVQDLKTARLAGTMMKIGICITILAFVSASALPTNCPVNVPVDCSYKCLNYSFDAEGKCLTCDCAPLEGLWEEDIKLDGPAKKLISGLLNGRAKAGGALLGKWMDVKSDGNWQIPFVINGMFYGPEMTAINDAMADFHTHTCLRFVPRTTESNYINIKQATGCWSYLGKRSPGNVNDISIGQGCAVKGIVIHELLHAIGFYHEHSRPDRDTYVQVFIPNVIPNMLSNFQKLTVGETDHFGSPYDLGSVMHYGPTAFSINGLPTIMLAGGQPYTSNQRDGFSTSDIAQVNSMYQCAPPCTDRRRRCRRLARKGKCRRRIIRKICPVSCNRCPSSPIRMEQCVDEADASYCNSMKAHCEDSDIVMEKCLRTCGIC